MINLHRYEALYYVGTYQGIGPTARNIPWTAGKSAVSKQIAAFEREIGTKLFVRDPFAWLPAGQRLTHLVIAPPRRVPKPPLRPHDPRSESTRDD